MTNDLPFRYESGRLTCEALSLADITAVAGTPTYVYSRGALLARAGAFLSAAPPRSLVCFAVKANGNPALLRLLAGSGLGADVTSGGELFLAQQAGFPAERIIFSGVGKSGPEIDTAVRAGIRALHVESEPELALVAATAARLARVTPVGVRVNPDIAVDTHPHISTGQQTHKFGVAPDLAVRLLRRAAADPWLRPVGLAVHIGSQIREQAPFIAAANFLVDMAHQMAAEGLRLAYLDAGGGLGLDYHDLAQNPVAAIADWVTAVAAPIAAAGYELVLEPGRAIAGPAGALVCQVLYTKEQGGRMFVVVDAGMNDLIRPALYQAHHQLLPLESPDPAAPVRPATVVGPICETGDTLAGERPLPPLQAGDRLAILLAGAYGFAMSSNYNGRLRPAEVLVAGDQFRIIRRRQSLAHLLDGCDPVDQATSG